MKHKGKGGEKAKGKGKGQEMVRKSVSQWPICCGCIEKILVGRYSRTRAHLLNLLQGYGPPFAHKVALWGDLPYRGESIDVFDPEDEYGPVYKQLSDTMNAYGPVFSIHSGDVKSGGGSCGELNYKRWEDIMDSFNHPAFISLGDNDWTDCHRLSNGNYDPLERLDYLRHRFYEDGHTIYGTGSFEYNMFNKYYPEMHWWVYGGIMYVNAHIIGSNNGLYDGVDRSCDQFLSMIDPNCAMSNAEANARTAVVNELVSAAFGIAKDEGLAGVMVAIQANIFGGPCLAWPDCDVSHPVVITNGFTDFWENLVHETLMFGKPVVLFHGDSHYYQVFENPDNRAENLVAVQNPGSASIGWVACDVDPDTDKVFHFSHVDVTPPERRGLEQEDTEDSMAYEL